MNRSLERDNHSYELRCNIAAGLIHQVAAWLGLAAIEKRGLVVDDKVSVGKAGIFKSA